MEQNSRPKKKKWPRILLEIAIIVAIASQIECTMAVPKCGGFCWKIALRQNSKKQNRFCRCK